MNKHMTFQEDFNENMNIYHLTKCSKISDGLVKKCIYLTPKKREYIYIYINVILFLFFK